MMNIFLKKSFSFILVIIFIFTIFSPLLVAAVGPVQLTEEATGGDASYFSGSSLIPCGRGTGDDCTFADFFVLMNNIIKFIAFNLVTPLVTATIAVSGIMLVIYPDNPGKRSTAFGLIKFAVIGFVLVFGSYVIVDAIVKSLGRSWVAIP